MTLIIVIVALSVIFQFVGAFMAIRLIRISGSHVAWMLLAGAFLGMGFRRAVTLSHILKGESQGDISVEILALLISLLVIGGISLIGPLFIRYRELNEKLEQGIDHAIDELRKKDQLLLVQSRHAAMGEMIGNIAHQWRQPLNMLALLVQELPIIYRKGEFSIEYLDSQTKKMLDTIRYMSKTIDDFRSFSSPDREKVDFAILETVEKTVSLLEGSLKTHQVKVVVVAEPEIIVHGYPNDFSQALLNIIINARDALVSRGVQPPWIRIEIGRKGEHCVVTVTDNAGGIPQDIIGRVFDPYFSTKGPDHGTGLGLYMTKMIVEKNMGGRISVRNTPDGAAFRIEV